MSDIVIFKGDRSSEISSAYKTYKQLQTVGPDSYFIESLSDIAFFIRDGEVRCMSLESDRDIATYDLLHLRDVGHAPIRHAIALYAAHHGLRVLSEESNYFQHSTKLTQYVALALQGISVPDTVFAVGARLAEAAEQFGVSYPAVAKAITGSNGRDNLLVQSNEELKTLPFANAVLQPFIPNNFDYRIIVAGGKALLAYKRIRQQSGGHKNNVADGARREIVETLPQEVETLAVRASGVLRRDLSGVDVLQDSETGKHYVLEVNANFGMGDLPDGINELYIERLAKYLHDRATQ